MAVSSDYDIHSARRIERLCKPLVLLETDVREQHGKIDIICAVSVADLADLSCRILYIYQSADHTLAFCVLKHFFCQYAYEHHSHPVDLLDEVRVEQARADVLDIHVGIDDRERRALFNEKHMRQTVVSFMIADRHDIRCEQVHDLDRREALELAVDQ